MENDIQRSIRLLLQSWGSLVTSPKETLISALKDNNFTSSEIEIIKPLIKQYAQGEITDDQIGDLVESITTEAQDGTQRIEDLINDYELDTVSKDPFFISSKNAYLESLFNRKKKRIIHETYQKLNLEPLNNVTVWLEKLKNKLDEATFKKAREVIDKRLNYYLHNEFNIKSDLTIEKIYDGQKKLEEMEEKMGLSVEGETIKESVKQFMDKNIESIFLFHLEKKLKANDFDETNKYIKNEIDKYPELKDVYENYVLEQEKIESKKTQQILEHKIKQSLGTDDFESAEILFNKLPYRSDFEYEYLKLVESRRNLIAVKEQIKEAIKNNDFKNAYEINKQNDFLLGEKLFSEDFLRAPLEKYLNSFSRKNFEMDADQALAVSVNERSCLVSARAGSGKTRVLLQRIALLTNRYNHPPKSILLLAFNRKVRMDIVSKLTNLYGWDESDAKQSIHTFHSFANSLIEKDKDSPELINTSADDDAELIRILGKLFDKRMSEDLKFEGNFRDYIQLNESVVESKLDESSFESKEDYYNFLKNQKYITFRRDHVKSRGEKYIANFLFEHGIGYKYETPIKLLEGKIYRPDFNIVKVRTDERDYWNLEGKEVYLEHWALKNENDRELPYSWDLTGEDYHDQMLIKRKFWATQKNDILLETWSGQSNHGYEAFAKILTQKLNEIDIYPQKLSDEELYSRLKARWREPLIVLFVQFIKKMQSSNMSLVDLDSILHSRIIDRDQELFFSLARPMFEAYQTYKKEKNIMDFSDLLDIASRNIKNAEKDSSLNQRISSIDAILIDEFQDFNPQFSDIVDSILKNNDCELLCVGDDWQAINSFMGADLKYFVGFENKYSNPKKHNMATNYRSASKIVHLGNQIMKGKGDVAQSSKIIEGRFEMHPIEMGKSFVDERFTVFHGKAAEYTDGKSSFDPGFVRAKYLRALYNIVKEHSNEEILILSRRKRFNGEALKEYEIHLKRLIKEDIKNKKSEWSDIKKVESSIEMTTVHTKKGGEAQTVIILGANEGDFPLLHPNNRLFNVFDANPDEYMNKNLEEERRLFYVAATRAIDNIYFVYEKGCPTPFL